MTSRLWMAEQELLAAVGKIVHGLKECLVEADASMESSYLYIKGSGWAIGVRVVFNAKTQEWSGENGVFHFPDAQQALDDEDSAALVKAWKRDEPAIKARKAQKLKEAQEDAKVKVLEERLSKLQQGQGEVSLPQGTKENQYWDDTFERYRQMHDMEKLKREREWRYQLADEQHKFKNTISKTLKKGGFP